MTESGNKHGQPDLAAVKSLLASLLREWDSRIQMNDIVALTPDASLRRYYRLSLEGSTVRTLVAMVFDSLASPESSAENTIRSDDAWILLCRYLARYRIAVPELFFASAEPPVILLEDLGDSQLFDLLAKGMTAEVYHYYQQAIDQLVLFQHIPVDQEFFAFKREFLAAPYFKEMLELTDFVLVPLGLAPSDRAALEQFFYALASELEGLPRVLAHRDFHSWNLIVDHSDNLRIIDFQDALMATRCYDVVALLNDRDTDAALGFESYRALLQSFWEKLGHPDWFEREYDLVLLQRDLKVAGRFGKLSNLRGLKQYEVWIPGTLRRIGRTLERLRNRGDKLERLALAEEILLRYLSDVRQGVAAPGPKHLLF